MSADASPVLGRDPRLSQEPGRLRQAHRHARRRRPGAGRRARSTPTSSWSTPARSSRRRGRSRSTRSWRWPTRARTAPVWWSPAAWPSATAPSWPMPCPRSTPSPASPTPYRSHSVTSRPCPTFDLLRLPGPKAAAPWAYVKVAEGCDRACGFCAIPSFRGQQRSRTIDDILAEVDALEAREIVLVAQDLASYGRDQGHGERRHRPARRGRRRARRPRAAAVPVPVGSHRPADRRGLRDRRAVLRSLAAARVALRCCGGCVAGATATGSSSHRAASVVTSPTPRSGPTSSSATRARPRTTTTSCCAFVDEAQLDWCGFFAFSRGGRARTPRGSTARSTAALMAERLGELRELPGGDHCGQT